MATMTPTDIESRFRAMEAEIAELKDRVERSELELDVRVSEAQFERGECMPASEALEMLRRKHNIPGR